MARFKERATARRVETGESGVSPNIKFLQHKAPDVKRGVIYGGPFWLLVDTICDITCRLKQVHHCTLK